jgi:hypothetical protein
MKHLPHSGKILSIFLMEEASTTFWGNPVDISGPHSPPMYMIQSLLYFQKGGSGATPFWEEGMGLLLLLPGRSFFSSHAYITCISCNHL